ncbi:MAG: sugar phosphate isomerase/epimerase [Verrucomicrobiota bacterium]
MKLPLSLSTSWLSKRHKDGYDMLTHAAQLGFEYVELSYGIHFSLWPGILKAVSKGIIKISSLHNFCPLPLEVPRADPNCYEFSDLNPDSRNLAIKYSMETIQHAAELGTKKVVLHIGRTRQKSVTRQLEELFAKGKFGSRKYTKLKIESVTQHETQYQKRWPYIHNCLSQLESYASSINVQLGIECRESAEEIPLDDQWQNIFNHFDSGVIGYWHDFGHAARKDCLGYSNQIDQFEQLAPRLLGCHVHDFLPPNRDHLPIGGGTIPFEKFWPYLNKARDPVMVLELSPKIKTERVQECLSWWNQHGPSLQTAKGKL